MIQTIKLWWRTRNTRAEAAEEHRGYKYAAVTLLDMGNAGADELQEMLEQVDDTPFHQGVARALFNWRNRGAHTQTLNYGRFPNSAFNWPELHDTPAVDYERGCRS